MIALLERNEGLRKLREAIGRGNPNANGKHETLMVAVSFGDAAQACVAWEAHLERTTEIADPGPDCQP